MDPAARGLRELHRIFAGPPPMPDVDVVYGHNPELLEEEAEARKAHDATRVQMAVPMPKSTCSCETKGLVMADLDLETRAEAGGEEGPAGPADRFDGVDTETAKKFVENLGRAAALHRSGSSRDALPFLRRCVNAVEDDFHSRWLFATVLRATDRIGEALRQLVCAAPFVPDGMLTEFFRVYLVLLSQIKGKPELLLRAFAVVQRHAPMGWKHPAQITRGLYHLDADKGPQARPVHPGFCEEGGTPPPALLPPRRPPRLRPSLSRRPCPRSLARSLPEAGAGPVCRMLLDNFGLIRDEALGVVDKAGRRNEDPFTHRAGGEGDLEFELESGGSLRLFDQAEGVEDAEGCAK